MLALRRALLATAALCGLLAIAPGCATKPNPVNVVEPQITTGVPTVIPDRRIICDPGLHSTIDIGDVNTDTTNEGLLRVQLRLTNLTRSFQSVEYRYEWTDNKGMLFNTPASRWVMVKLKPKDSILVLGVAPNPNVKDFTFKVNTRD